MSFLTTILADLRSILWHVVPELRVSAINRCPDVESRKKINMEHPPVPSKTWELSLYELHRTPQEAITDSTEIAVSPKSLHNELMCPICLDMLKNTMTTKECLHRFCQECIITALRAGNKECPTCRKKLVSKRSLRPDPNFDDLISKIYPSREEYEAHQDRVLKKLKQHHNANAFTHSIEEGLRLQALNRAQRVRKHNTDGGDPPVPGDRPADSANSTPTTPASTPNNTLPSPITGPPPISTPSSDSGQPPSVVPRKRVRTASEDSAGESNHSVGDSSSVAGESAPDTSTEKIVSDVELVFKPHPQEDHSDINAATRYVKTTANATGAWGTFGNFQLGYILLLVI